jgi:HlyD family secretion protein
VRLPRPTRIAAAILLLGCFYALYAAYFGTRPVAVRITRAERGRVEQTVTNSRAGTVKARRRARLSPEVGGRVVALPHPEGSLVRKGDLLLQIDGAVQQAQLAVAEREQMTAAAQRDQSCLQADLSERERQRAESLERSGVLSVELLDQTRSAAQTARAACLAAGATVERVRASVALARTQVQQTRLLAPFDGVVAELSIEVGEWTTPSPAGLPIPSVIDLIDPTSIHISAPMDEVDSARMKPGQAAKITVDSHPGRSFPGRVTRLAPYVVDVEAQNRTMELEAELDDAALARSLLPGTSADVEVVLSAKDGVLRLPTTALLEGGRVLLLAGGLLVERRVTTGVRNWDFTEIESGLAPGDSVVLSLDRAEVKAGARATLEPERTP